MRRRSTQLTPTVLNNITAQLLECTGAAPDSTVVRVRSGQSSGRCLAGSDATSHSQSCTCPQKRRALTICAQPVRIVAPNEGGSSLLFAQGIVTATTGWKVEFTLLPFTNLGRQIVEQSALTGKGYYDGWSLSTTSTVDVLEAGMVEPQDSYVLQDSRMEWTDVLR